MLRLTLAGIDSNDQAKSLRTLVFYRNLVMWVPVGGPVTSPREDGGSVTYHGNDGTTQVGERLTETRYGLLDSADYRAAVARLPEGSVLAPPAPDAGAEGHPEEMREAMLAMADWSLAFLDRVYELLRAAGEQEKLGKGQGGTGYHRKNSARNRNRGKEKISRLLFSKTPPPTWPRLKTFPGS